MSAPPTSSTTTPDGGARREPDPTGVQVLPVLRGLGGPVGDYEPVPDPPLINADAAAKALQEYFLVNADRGDNAANDELVAELVRRMRARQASREGGC